jgi:hypothetical protein
MSRAAARFTQADIARAVRAGKQAGASDVELRRDGTIVLKLSPSSTGGQTESLEPECEVIL